MNCYDKRIECLLARVPKPVLSTVMCQVHNSVCNTATSDEMVGPLMLECLQQYFDSDGRFQFRLLLAKAKQYQL